MRKQLEWDGVLRLARFKRAILSFYGNPEFYEKNLANSWEEYALQNPTGNYLKIITLEGESIIIGLASLTIYKHRLLDSEEARTPALSLAISQKQFILSYYSYLPLIVAEAQYEHNKSKLRESRSEQSIEKVLTEGVKKLGGLCFKVSSENHVGLPDRLIIYKGMTLFVELKRQTGTLSESQVVRHNQFREQGNTVITLYGIEEVNKYLNCLATERTNNLFLYEEGTTHRITRQILK